MPVTTINIPGLDSVEGRLPYDKSAHSKKDKRPFHLKEAPVVYPTVDEFKDPYSYINSLHDIGLEYGIVKIVPPEKWNPKFSIDVGSFKFDCRKQKLNTMGAVTRSTMDWVKRMSNFHYLFDSINGNGGRPMVKYPILGNTALNYYKLKEIVHRLGGYKKINADSLWPLVCAKLEISTIADNETANTIKDLYHKYVLPYEEYIAYFDYAKSAKMNQDFIVKSEQPVEAAESYLNRWTYRQSINVSTPDHTMISTIYTSPPRSDRESGGRYEIIYRNVKTDKPSGSNHNELPPSPPPESRKRFNSYTNPNSKRIFLRRISTSKHKEESPRIIKSCKTRSKQVVEETDEDSEIDETDICHECNHFVYESPLKCKECEHTFHVNCLSPIIAINSRAPKWFCPNCIVGTGEFYFDQGEQYDLPTFQEMANDFKSEYLEDELPIVDPNDTPLVECLVEQLFWHHVNDPNCKIAVEYGADIRCDVKGSGFPTVTKSPSNKYSKDPWNLNNVPVNKMSLFRHLKTDISGVTVPWAYVGMMFSAFCWHSEDHYTYSINYQHFGDTKTWYGIPGSFAEKFETTSKQLVPDLFEKQPDILFQRATMIPPDILVRNGVPVYVVDQHPGEFVITFPNAYHSGFNHGFNFNEAVNYAPPNWVKYGKEAVVSYKEQFRSPIFSHDELLIRTALNDRRPLTAEWLYPYLKEILKEEIKRRNQIDFSIYNIRETVKPITGGDEDSYECCICSCLCYTSRLIPEGKSKVYCYDHFHMDNSYDFELEQNYSLSELEEICQEVKELIE